jgi:vacuolar-type H+-ATPase subunit E/Vma4
VNQYYSPYFTPGPPLGNFIDDAKAKVEAEARKAQAAAQKQATSTANQAANQATAAIQNAIPGLENQIVGIITSGATKVLNNMWPDVERRVDALAGKYEKRYMSMVADWEKYAVPVAMVAVVVGAMVASASYLTIRNEVRKRKGG